MGGITWVTVAKNAPPVTNHLLSGMILQEPPFSIHDGSQLHTHMAQKYATGKPCEQWTPPWVKR